MQFINVLHHGKASTSSFCNLQLNYGNSNITRDLFPPEFLEFLSLFPSTALPTELPDTAIART